MFLYIDNRPPASVPPYPVLPSAMTGSTDSLRQLSKQQQQPVKYVKVLHTYDAQHDDELSIRPGKMNILFKIFI